MGERAVEAIGKQTLARLRAMPIAFQPFPRCYVRVILGSKELLHIDFNADTLMETRAAERVRAKLQKHPDARAYVSERCKGALAGFPEVGVPIAVIDDTHDNHQTETSGRGLVLLRRLKRNGKVSFGGSWVYAINRLVTQGYVTRDGDLLKITAAGMAALEMENEK